MTLRRLAALIGSPVEHSLSPVIHQAAFDAAGVDWTYVAFDVAAGGGAGALDAMRVLGIAGLSVTMPHKREVADAVDRLEPAARALQSVNTVSWDGDRARRIEHRRSGVRGLARRGRASTSPMLGSP